MYIKNARPPQENSANTPQVNQKRENGKKRILKVGIASHFLVLVSVAKKVNYPSEQKVGTEKKGSSISLFPSVIFLFSPCCLYRDVFTGREQENVNLKRRWQRK